MSSWVVKRFDSPDSSTTTDLGRIELLEIGGVSIGRATYQPGWVWSSEMGVLTGERWCDVSHVGLVVRGSCTIEMMDGTEFILHAGDLFAIDPGHDSRVVGDEVYESLHLVGIENYIQTQPTPSGVA